MFLLKKPLLILTQWVVLGHLLNLLKLLVVLMVLNSNESSLISKCLVNALGAHTVNYKYEENKPPKEVIVSRKCAEAVLRGAQVGIV